MGMDEGRAHGPHRLQSAACVINRGTASDVGDDTVVLIQHGNKAWGIFVRGPLIAEVRDEDEALPDHCIAGIPTGHGKLVDELSVQGKAFHLLLVAHAHQDDRLRRVSPVHHATVRTVVRELVFAFAEIATPALQRRASRIVVVHVVLAIAVEDIEFPAITKQHLRRLVFLCLRIQFRTLWAG